MATNPMHIVSPGEGNLGGPRTKAQKSAKPKPKPTYYKPKPKSGGLLGGIEHGLKSDVKVLKKADDLQAKVTGIHAKTAVKTYADPFRKDYWKQLGGSGKSILSPKQQKEQQAFADSVMMFHGIGGAAGGLAKFPEGVRRPGAVAVGHAAAKAKPAVHRLATEQTGMLGLGRGAIPENNYLHDLAPYGPLHRETNLAKALEFLPASRIYRAMHFDTVHMANDVSMALGQGNNKGVMLEFEGKGLQGQRNTAKPGLALVDSHELIGKFNTQEQYQNSLRGFRVMPGALADKVTRRKFQFVENELINDGWTKTVHPDGSVSFRKPESALKRLATEETGMLGIRRGAKPEAAKAADTVRLYRGSGAHSIPAGNIPDWMVANRGRWFTSDPSIAARYAKQKGGAVSFVDVPKHIAESSKVTGGSGGEEFILPHEVASGAQPWTASHQVQHGMGTARTARKAQEAGYSAERGQRAANYAQALKENPTLAGHEAAKAHLAGELPKVPLAGGLSELTPETVDAMVKTVAEHPHLLPYQRTATIEGIKKASQGITPTHSELDKIQLVFGPEAAKALSDPANLSKWQHAKGIGIEVMNIPRSVMASFDLSAPFRQGLVAGARHPVIFSKNFAPMVKAWKSQKVYDEVMGEIHARPSFPKMHEAKLAVQEMGSSDLSKREEQFYSNFAEKGKYNPIRSSSRAYTLFLTKMRADVFDHLLPRLAADGHDINDPEFLQALGKYINSATGRGSLGNFESGAHLLNTMFFSPRLMMSRLNLLSPVYYTKLPAGVRKEALRAALQTIGTLTTMLTLASYGGAKVIRDPRNADFGKIKLGNTRIDIAAGFQQPIKTLAQILTATRISSQTGNKSHLGGGFGEASKFDVALQFFTNKASPPAAIGVDYLKQDNFGKPFSWKGEAASKLTPLLAQDAKDIYNEKQGGVDGITAAFLGYGIGAFGLGIQTYGNTPTGSSSSGSSGSSGSNPLASTSGGSTSNPLAPAGGGGNANPMAVGG